MTTETETTETTESVLREMLAENTGTHFLDSGGDYGRHWQQNQGRDFSAEPETLVEFTTWNDRERARLCVEVTHNVYHWLRQRLEFNPELDASWQAWCAENGEGGQLDAMQGFVDALQEGFREEIERSCIVDGAHGIHSGPLLAERIDRDALTEDVSDETWADLADVDSEWHDDAFREVLSVCRIEHDDGTETRWETCPDGGGVFEVRARWVDARECGGIYNDGEPFTHNTYNGEDLLSQTLQFIYWTDEDGAHVLLQIHGGADVRGGYTDARVFDVGGPMGDDGTEIFDNARASVYVDESTVRPAPGAGTPCLPGFEAWGDTRPHPNALCWDSDDGCTFRGTAREMMPDGSYDVPDLESFEIVKFYEDDSGIQRAADGRPLDDVRGTGVLCVDDDGNAWCALTGGRLLAAPF